MKTKMTPDDFIKAIKIERAIAYQCLTTMQKNLMVGGSISEVREAILQLKHSADCMQHYMILLEMYR
jgi:hypothetical protein